MLMLKNRKGTVTYGNHTECLVSYNDAIRNKYFMLNNDFYITKIPRIRCDAWQKGSQAKQIQRIHVPYIRAIIKTHVNHKTSIIFLQLLGHLGYHSVNN